MKLLLCQILNIIIIVLTNVANNPASDNKTIGGPIISGWEESNLEPGCVYKRVQPSSVLSTASSTSTTASTSTSTATSSSITSTSTSTVTTSTSIASTSTTSPITTTYVHLRQLLGVLSTYITHSHRLSKHKYTPFSSRFWIHAMELSLCWKQLCINIKI